MKERLTGRIVADATAYGFEGSKQVINFSLAIDKSYLKKGTGQRVKRTLYVDCAMWRKGDIPRLLKKGVLVEVSGDLEAPKVFQNKYGEYVARIVFTVGQVQPLAWPAKVSGNAQPVNAGATAQQEPVSDDLPF